MACSTTTTGAVQQLSHRIAHRVFSNPFRNRRYNSCYPLLGSDRPSGWRCAWMCLAHQCLTLHSSSGKYSSDGNQTTGNCSQSYRMKNDGVFSLTTPLSVRNEKHDMMKVPVSGKFAPDIAPPVFMCPALICVPGKEGTVLLYKLVQRHITTGSLRTTNIQRR